MGTSFNQFWENLMMNILRSFKSEYREHFIINIGKILITFNNQHVTIFNGKMGNNVHLTININRAINIGNIENI